MAFFSSSQLLSLLAGPKFSSGMSGRSSGRSTVPYSTLSTNREFRTLWWHAARGLMLRGGHISSRDQGSLSFSGAAVPWIGPLVSPSCHLNMCYRRSSIVDLGPGGWWFPIIVPCLVTAPVSRPLSFPTLLYPTLGLERLSRRITRG